MASQNAFIAHSWLQKKGAGPFPEVGFPDHSVDLPECAASALYDYWSSFVSQAEESAATQVLADFFCQFDMKVGNERPSLDAFRDRLWKTKGCPGMDGWNRAALQALAAFEAASNAVWDTMWLWEQSGRAPQQL